MASAAGGTAPEVEKRSGVSGPYEMVVRGLAVAMSLYHLGIAWLGVPVAILHRPLHVLFAFSILFLTTPSRGEGRGRLRLMDGLLVLLTVLSTGFLIVNARDITNRIPYVYDLTLSEMVFGTVFLLVVLEAARRTVGWALVLVSMVFLVYGYAGKYLPYPFWHRGFTPSQLIEQVYMTLEGVWSTPIYVTSTYVFLFILFGAFLVSTGAGDFFTDLARSLTARTVGGPAKTAVVSSALMGMLSGSSVANVVTTGPFTIPAMKREGYAPHFAGAVEAVASSGGQIMPPIMGAAAFIMAEFTGIPYVQIMKHAIVPAFLYFFSVFMMVDLEARRLGLHPATSEAVRPLWDVLKHRGYLFIPILAIVALLVQGYTPLRAAAWAIVILVGLVVLFDPPNRRRIGWVILQSLEEAPKLVVSVTAACAAAGIIVGVILMTGLGLRITSIVLQVSQGNLAAALVLTMLVAIVLGMGMPTSSAYIIMAALLAPGLVQLGVPVVAAHMFVMFFASMSAITPPVAIASYAAAGVADANPMKTGLTAFRLGIAAFIVPFMFVYGPSLLLIGNPWTIVLSVITAVVGVAALAAAAIGWVKGKANALERLALLAAALTLIVPGLRSDLVGAVILAITVMLHLARLRRADAVRAGSAFDKN